MPQSLSAVHVHAIFSTKDRRPFLRDKELSAELHAYLGGISKNQGCPPVIVGGFEDHVHILALQSRSVTLSDWIKEIKRSSTLWCKQRNPEFAWQSGYGAFSVSPDHLGSVRQYIADQEEHHRVVSFQEEFLRLLEEHNLGWDNRYVWD